MSLHGSPFFINALSGELNAALKGQRFTEAFSTGKDDLFLVFDTRAIRISFWKGEGILSFPEPVNLPRKKRINQFKEAWGIHVDEVETILLERAFRIRVGNFSLFFKLFGMRANVLFIEGDSPLLSFRHNLKKDLETGIASLDSGTLGLQDIVLTDFERFSTLYPFMRGDLLNWIFSDEGSEGQHDRLEQVKELLVGPEWLLIRKDAYSIGLRGIPAPGEVISASRQAMEIQHEFGRVYVTVNRFAEAKARVTRELEREINRMGERISRLSHEIKKKEGSTRYKEYADLLMANMHGIDEGLEEVQLADFETNEMRTIPLKKDLSAQKNAERYYRKAKREHLELEQLQKQLLSGREKLTELESDLSKARSANFMKELPEIRETGNRKEDDNQPYKVTTFKGYEIWIGKHAQSNEVILRKASKLDIWLHVRDISGPHVLIRNPGKKKIPEYVISAAASLAAGHSRRKTEGLVAVIYTERRYVRKFKGALPGQVKVERENVILVPPEQSL